MKSVGAKSNILRVSLELNASLKSAGRKRAFPPARVLFRAGKESVGVFLVCSGKADGCARHAPAGQSFFRGLAAGIARDVYRMSVQPDRRGGGSVGYSSRTTGRISAAHARASRPLSRSNRYAGMRANFYPVGAGETMPTDCQSELATICRDETR